MTRSTDRLDRIEETLAAVVEAVNANADETAQRQAEILRALRSLDGTVADLAEAVQVVMAARTKAKRLATTEERGEGSRM